MGNKKGTLFSAPHSLICLTLLDSPHRVVMVEALSEDLTVDDLMHYYDSCDFAFNFNFIVHLESPLTADGLLQQTNDWLDNMPEGKTANWVVRQRFNHHHPLVNTYVRVGF